MNEIIPSQLSHDPDGLLTYEYIANHISPDPDCSDCDPDTLGHLVENLIRVDANGQFTVSAARYLHAINPEAYRKAIDTLVEAAIEKDRAHAYIGDLLPAIWGQDYANRADELSAADRNFRRIYKRLFPQGAL